MSDKLIGWQEIADFIEKSIPTTMKLARELKAPITMMAGTPFSTTGKLGRWKSVNKKKLYGPKKLTEEHKLRIGRGVMKRAWAKEERKKWKEED